MVPVGTGFGARCSNQRSSVDRERRWRIFATGTPYELPWKISLFNSILCGQINEYEFECHFYVFTRSVLGVALSRPENLFGRGVDAIELVITDRSFILVAGSSMF